MPLNLTDKQIQDIANRTMQRIQDEENYRSVSEIPSFPFSSVSEIHSLVKQKKLHFLIYADVDLISRFGSRNAIKLKKTVTTLQTTVFWVLLLGTITLAVTLSNYWLLLCIPFAFIGTMTTSPTSSRYLFFLLAIGLFIYSFFIDNQFWKFAALIFSMANILNNVLRFINEGTILNIIYQNEPAFVWGFFNKAFLIKVVKTGEPLILMPGLPEAIQEANFEQVRLAVYGY
jgi:hypothetical protein